MSLNPLTRTAFHALAAVTALLVVGCGESGSDSAWWSGENEKIALEHDLELKKFRFEQVHSTDFAQLESLKKANWEASASLEKLTVRKKELSAEIESLQTRKSEFRSTAIRQQRQRAMGEVFDEMTLASGRSFRKVSVSSIDDAGVTIRHEDGSAKLRFGDLNAEQQVFFGLEGDLALVAEGQEQKNAVAYEQWVDTRMAEVREEKRAAAEVTRRQQASAERERVAIASANAAASRSLLAANTSPLAKSARSFSRGSLGKSYSTYRRSYRIYSPSYRYSCYGAYRSSRNNSQLRYLKTGQGMGIPAPR